MNDVERILRAESLKKKIKRLYRLLDKKNQEMFNLQEECKHEIVVVSGRYYQRCLFCEKLGYHHTSFWESEVIEAKDNVFGVLSSEKRFEIVKQAYLKAAMDHPELNTSELRKLIEDEIKAIENTLT